MEYNPESPFIIVSILAFIFSSAGFFIALKLEFAMQAWMRALNRIEWMLGIKQSKLLSFKEFRELVRQMEERQEFDRVKYNKFGVYDDQFDDKGDDEL